MTDWTQLIVSYILGLIFSYVSFEAVDNLRRSREKKWWVLGGGITMGMGIWAMHFVAMTAYLPKGRVFVEPWLMFASVIPAVVLCCWMLSVLRNELPFVRVICLGLKLETAIFLTEYYRMHALQLSQSPIYNSKILGLGIATGLIVCVGTVRLYQWCYDSDNFSVFIQVCCSLIVTFAMALLHFIIMSAITFSPHTHYLIPDSSIPINVPRLLVWVAVIIMFITLVGSSSQKEKNQKLISMEHIKALETAKKSEKLAVVGKLASSIAHEINNPLSAVVNCLYLLEGANLNEEERMILGMASQELNRATQIATNVLRFHRQASGPSWFCLSDMCDSVLTVYSSRSLSREINIERRYDPIPEIYGLSGEIRQVVANLIGNAQESMFVHGNGKLIIATHRIMDQIVLTIADTGEGIPLDKRHSIFEPFFTTKEESGTGLGLWISQEIVQRHGGTIRFRSAVGKGTVFQMRLPGRALSIKPVMNLNSLEEKVHVEV